MPRIADEVKPAGENPGPWMLWIYGDYGAGKTVLAAGFPGYLGLDTEGSRRSLLNHESLVKTPFLQVRNFEHLKKIAEAIIAQQDEVFQQAQVIGLDTLSTLQMKELNEQMKIVGQKQGRHPDLPSEGEFNINNTRIRKLLLDLKERSGKNIVILSHIKEEKDDSGQTILVRPGNSPSLSSTIASLCDGMFYLNSKTDSKGATTRTLKCMPNSRFWAKNRFAATLEKEIVNPTAQDILDAIERQQQLAIQYSNGENEYANH